MEVKIANKRKSHTKYYLKDGGEVKGVTTYLKVINKPSLIKWANNLGLKGIDSNKYVDEKADIGTCAHYLIECSLKNIQPDLSEYSPYIVEQAETCFLKWLEYAEPRNIKMIESELKLVSEKYQFGGTIDIYGIVEDQYTLIDIKTSGSGIWPEMKHQVSAYRELLLENGYPVDRVIIVRVGRSTEEGFETTTIKNPETHFQLFLHAQAIYNLQKLLKKEKD